MKKFATIDKNTLFKIDDLSYDRTWVRYFVYAFGVDRTGNNVLMVVNYDPHASGCNPYHWSPSPYCRHGHGFSSEEDARQQAIYAAGSWDVKSVDKTTVQVGALEFHETRSVREL